jgi:hypothetical protein
MERPASVLPLGIALLMGAAVFVAVNPPPAMRVIRLDKVAVSLSDPCLKNSDAKAKNPACGARHPLHPAKPAPPFQPLQPKYKTADPFWDRG